MVVVSEGRPPSLRERKKARTRASLIAVSQTLFAEQGYTATTLDDISARVEVTPQTLLRYFDSKAALAVAPMADATAELRAFLDDPHRAVDALVVWREFQRLEVAEVAEPSRPETPSQVHNLRSFQRWGQKHPELVARVTDLDRQLREMLAAALARDWGAGDDDLHAIVVAGALVAGRHAVWRRWLVGDDAPDPLLGDLLAVVDYVETHLPRGSAAELTPNPDDHPEEAP
jgi:AcrR family transcriptional regulator